MKNRIGKSDVSNIVINVKRGESCLVKAEKWACTFNESSGDYAMSAIRKWDRKWFDLHMQKKRQSVTKYEFSLFCTLRMNFCLELKKISVYFEAL